MEWVVALVALVAVLVLVGRGMPRRAILVATVVALAAVVLIVVVERAGLWPQNWRVH